MNRIATREWSPFHEIFSRPTFRNRPMKTIARFESARRERNAPRPAPVIDQVMAEERAAAIAGQRLLGSAELFHRRDRVDRIAQEEIFGLVLSVMTSRTPDEVIERANNTLRFKRRCLDRQRQQDFQDREQTPRRRGLGERLQQIRSHQSVRRLQGKRLRPRRRSPRSATVPNA
jgi:hypothetical protein